MVFDDVKKFIGEKIFHSSGFDALTVEKQNIAVKNAEDILYTMFKTYKPETNPLPVSAIAYQTLWIIAKDSTMQKVDMGLTSQMIDGMSQSFTQADRTLAPEVKQILRKKVGSYGITVGNTFRGVYE